MNLPRAFGLNDQLRATPVARRAATPTPRWRPPPSAPRSSPSPVGLSWSATLYDGAQPLAELDRQRAERHVRHRRHGVDVQPQPARSPCRRHSRRRACRCRRRRRPCSPAAFLPFHSHVCDPLARLPSATRRTTVAGRPGEDHARRRATRVVRNDTVDASCTPSPLGDSQAGASARMAEGVVDRHGARAPWTRCRPRRPRARPRCRRPSAAATRAPPELTLPSQTRRAVPAGRRHGQPRVRTDAPPRRAR